MANSRWNICISRDKLIQIPEKEVIEEGSNVSNKIEKTLYEYYLCDVCFGKVRTQNYGKKYQKNGAIITYRTPGGRKFKLVFHNECLKKGLQELNKYFESEVKKNG